MKNILPPFPFSGMPLNLISKQYKAAAVRKMHKELHTKRVWDI